MGDGDDAIIEVDGESPGRIPARFEVLPAPSTLGGPSSGLRRAWNSIGAREHQNDRGRDQCVVAGEGNAEEAELHFVAGDDALRRCRCAEVVEAEATAGAGAGGLAGPEAPFDAGVVARHVGRPTKMAPAMAIKAYQAGSGSRFRHEQRDREDRQAEIIGDARCSRQSSQGTQ